MKRRETIYDFRNYVSSSLFLVNSNRKQWEIDQSGGSSGRLYRGTRPVVPGKLSITSGTASVDNQTSKQTNKQENKLDEKI